jgi:hypothetical protein
MRSKFFFTCLLGGVYVCVCVLGRHTAKRKKEGEGVRVIFKLNERFLCERKECGFLACQLQQEKRIETKLVTLRFVVYICNTFSFPFLCSPCASSSSSS